MADYYSILGLTKNATDIEIKAAFRKLAKIYHPDKNPDPNARQLFEHILKAYDTLINPHTRRRYDSLGTTSTAQQKQRQHRANPKTRGQKEWNVEEEDLKRREYYKKHYHHVKSKVAHTETTKTTYSDYKYVLFATPIAVGLLMIIVSLFNSAPKTEPVFSKSETPVVEPKAEKLVLNNGDKPYRGFFGNIQTFQTTHTLQINNSSMFDAVIVVFDKKTNHYLQHGYLKSLFTIEFANLPDNGVYWKCMLGKNWNDQKLFLNEKIIGGFDSIVQYQNWKTEPTLFNNQPAEELTMLYVLDNQPKSKKHISSEMDFFENQK